MAMLVALTLILSFTAFPALSAEPETSTNTAPVVNTADAGQTALAVAVNEETDADTTAADTADQTTPSGPDETVTPETGETGTPETGAAGSEKNTGSDKDNTTAGDVTETDSEAEGNADQEDPAAGRTIITPAGEVPDYISDCFKISMVYQAQDGSQTPNNVTLPAGHVDSWLDLSNAVTLTVKGSVENTSDQAAPVNVWFQYPLSFTGYQENTYIPILNELPTLAGDTTGLKFDYTYAADDKSPGNLKQIHITGTLAPKGKIEVTAPMQPITKDTEGKKYRVLGGAGVWSSEQKTTVLSILPQVLTESSYTGDVDTTWEDGNKKVVATLTNDNYTDPMTDPVEDEFIQSLMPVASPDWIYFSRSGENGLNAMTSPADGDDTIYSTSSYRILTEPIFDAIKDQGYSTRYKDSTGKDIHHFWPYYTYSTWTKKTLTDSDGTPYNKYEDLGQSKYYYASVFKVLDTKNLRFAVGSDEAKAWNEYSNLTYSAVPGPEAGENNEVRVDASTVDVTTPGTYPVTYYFDIDDTHTVSKAATVEVYQPLKPHDPGDSDDDDDDPDDPDKPDDPVTPDNPDTPDDPADPETPAQPEEPNTVTPAAPDSPVTPDQPAATTQSAASNSPKTGDATDLGRNLALLVGSAGLLAGLAFRRRKTYRR